MCTDTDGSYVCSCTPGYLLNSDNRGCDGMSSITATLCIYLNNTCTCIDIDECFSGIDLCAHNCTNSIGSYLCSCDTGYRLNANGFQCDGKVNIQMEYSGLQSSNGKRCAHSQYGGDQIHNLALLSLLLRAFLSS